METLETLLRDVPVFSGLADDQLALVAGCGSNVHIDEDAVLFREGDAADVFYLIRDGVVALETFTPARGSITIETLEAGEVAGARSRRSARRSSTVPAYAASARRTPRSASRSCPALRRC